MFRALAEHIKIGKLRKSTEFPSLREFFKIVLPSEQYLRMIADCCDSRMYAYWIANALGVQEEVVVKETARRLHLPYLERVRPLVEILSEQQAPLSTFRKCGAIPIMNDEMCLGIACIDPALLAPLKASMVPVYCATWRSICKALDESEKNIIHAKKHEHYDRNKAKIVAYRILEHILNDASQRNADTIEFRFANKLLFRLIREGRLISESEIRPDISHSVWHCLQHPRLEIQLPKSLPDRCLKKIAYDQEARTLVLALHENTKESASEYTGSSEVRVSECQSREKKQVLLVDDNESYLKVLARFLQKRGIETLSAQSVDEALEVLASGSLPDLIVSDVHMPQRNGFELLRTLQQKPRLQTTPVLVLTSDFDVTTEVSAYKEGATALLRKSDDPKLLCAQIERLLSCRIVREAA